MEDFIRLRLKLRILTTRPNFQKLALGINRLIWVSFIQWFLTYVWKRDWKSPIVAVRLHLTVNHFNWDKDTHTRARARCVTRSHHADNVVSAVYSELGRARNDRTELYVCLYLRWESERSDSRYRNRLRRQHTTPTNRTTTDNLTQQLLCSLDLFSAILRAPANSSFLHKVFVVADCLLASHSAPAVSVNTESYQIGCINGMIHLPSQASMPGWTPGNES